MTESHQRMTYPIERLAKGVAPHAVLELGEHGGFSINLTAEPIRLPPSPILEAVGTVFTLDGFAIPRTPLVVGRAKLDKLPKEISVSDIVIKGPGEEYRVPKELEGLQDFLTVAATAEIAINPDVDNYFAYLTVQRTWVNKREIKRSPGAHSDSIQGPRIQPKVAIEHGYTSTDSAPTRFFTHRFDLAGLDPDTHWLNVEFEAQKIAEQSRQFEPEEVVLFDAYTVHEPVEAKADGIRTFTRLIYSTRVFDRAGNTRNRLFDYDWNFVPRPVPRDLIGMPQN